ncbi:hypothetical protein [Bacillus mycoides]|uniref:hypothetical protein n=1 Tax=Bacillus mycoides TaxID=1405 RepID=UPI001879EABB|nr:hypothetical protein [Bacillus mycoides]MBE7124565.1 hypothetical protein [Bacillus mycoides]
MEFNKIEWEEKEEGLNEKSTKLSKLEFIESLKEEANKYFKQAEKHFREFIVLVAAHKENEKEADDHWFLWEVFNAKGICLQEEAKKLYT